MVGGEAGEWACIANLACRPHAQGSGEVRRQRSDRWDPLLQDARRGGEVCGGEDVQGSGEGGGAEDLLARSLGEGVGVDSGGGGSGGRGRCRVWLYVIRGAGEGNARGAAAGLARWKALSALFGLDLKWEVSRCGEVAAICRFLVS